MDLRLPAGSQGLAAAPARGAGPYEIPGSPLGCALLSRDQVGDGASTLCDDDPLPLVSSFEVVAELSSQSFDADFSHAGYPNTRLGPWQGCRGRASAPRLCATVLRRVRRDVGAGRRGEDGVGDPLDRLRGEGHRAAVVAET